MRTREFESGESHLMHRPESQCRSWFAKGPDGDLTLQKPQINPQQQLFSPFWECKDLAQEQAALLDTDLAAQYQPSVICTGSRSQKASPSDVAHDAKEAE